MANIYFSVEQVLLLNKRIVCACELPRRFGSVWNCLRTKIEIETQEQSVGNAIIIIE